MISPADSWTAESAVGASAGLVGTDSLGQGEILGSRDVGADRKVASSRLVAFSCVFPAGEAFGPSSSARIVSVCSAERAQQPVNGDCL